MLGVTMVAREKAGGASRSLLDASSARTNGLVVAVVKEGVTLEAGVATCGRLKAVEAGLVARWSAGRQSRSLRLIVVVAFGSSRLGRGGETLSAVATLLACAMALLLAATSY
jgi:hypothetical protein